MEKKRILWLDGVKGLACMLVFIHHYIVGFFPAMYFGDMATSHIGRFPMIEREIAQSPFTAAINGNFMVCLFCMISSMVLSKQVLNSDNKGEVIGRITAKRYFRIAIPVFFSQLLILLMKKYDLFCSVQAGELTGSYAWLREFYKYPYTIEQLLRCSFVGVPFIGDSTFNTAYWMLNQLLFGGMISVALSAMVVSGKKCALFISAVWAAGLLYCSNFYASFALGVILAILLEETQKCPQWIAIVLMILGCFLGAYPSGVQPDNVYRYLYAMVPSGINAYIFWHQIGSMLLLLGISRCEAIKCFFSWNPVLFLGKISYSVYLIHIPLMCSFSCILFLRMQQALVEHYSLVCLCILIVTTVVLIILSWVFHNTVERMSDVCTNCILRNLRRMDSSNLK